MTELAIKINNLPYSVACDDGQEDQLRQLADFVHDRAQKVKASAGYAGENRILVMTSLMIADELADAYAHIEKLEQQQEQSVPNATATQLAQKIEHLAASLEAIAGSLENT